MNIWYIIGSIAAIIPVILIKEYTVSKNNNLLLLCLLCYLILISSYVHIFNNKVMSSAYTLIQILQILIIVLSGIMLFKEKITSKTLFGIFLAIAAMYYLNK
jgi:multidrug transporter EmrE-like cation transporter